MTVKAAAALASTSEITIRNEIDAGQLGHFRVGRKILIRRQALENWLESRERLVMRAYAAMPESLSEESVREEARN